MSTPLPAASAHRPAGSAPAPSTVPDVLPAPLGMPALTLQELFERLGWFVSIRWFAGVGALLLVLVGWHVFDVRIPPRPVAMTIGTLFIYNAFFLLLVTDAYRRQRVGPAFVNGCANAQIVCDLITLALLMHYTGGVENPFIVFFICPLVIASELLPNRVAYQHALFGALLINFVAWAEYSGILPHVGVGRFVGAETYQNTLFVAKFTLGLSALAFATVFLGGSIAHRLRFREAELQRAHDQLRELERSKSFLMRRTSHDLRAPLDAIVSILRALTIKGAQTCDAELTALLQRAEQRAVGLTHLIRELNRYAVLRDAADSLPREPIDVAQLVNQSVGLYRTMAADHDLTIQTDLTPSALVRGNGDALTEVVGNLLSNAIRYTPAGGEIHVRLHNTRRNVVLSIRDTGIGIPSTALERVFSEYYRTDNAKRFCRDGTGMGLPIVKRIIDLHDGSVTVDSRLNQGTTFTITLPGQPLSQPSAATRDRRSARRESIS